MEGENNNSGNSENSRNSGSDIFSDNLLIKVQTTDWNSERLETLKKLFPDLFTNEGKLNINELKKVVDPENVSETERYEFRWFGKSNARRNAFTPSNATLILDKERSYPPIKSSPFDNQNNPVRHENLINPGSDNLIIEGENLEVLKLLSGSYREKIKCIYIDPPYNTGGDFVYSDDYSQDKKAYWEQNGILNEGIKIDTNTESSGRFHSDWLNMMYSRLLIARQFLKNDGVIFLSIDDNEIHHLRKICDEVFGEDNFVAIFVWKSRQNKDNRSTTGASIDHEYVLCYSKNNDNKALKGSERKVEQYSNPDNDSRGDWASGNMVGILPENLRPNCHYDLINPKTGINYGKPKMGWRYDQNTMNRLIEEDRILWPHSEEGRPRRKVFISELNDSFTGFSSIIGENIYTRDGTKEIEDLFSFRAFDFPKPSAIIEELVNQVLEDGDIFLDFFAGSGSSGQAILDLNQQNGRQISFILVQIPERTNEKSEAYSHGLKKLSDITIERNKRVIEKIKSEQKLQELKDKQNLFGTLNSGNSANFRNSGSDNLGFKVFKLVKSNFPRVEFAPDPHKTDEENIELLKKYIRDKEAQMVTAFNRDELLTEILLKNNFTLNYKTTNQEQFKKNEILHVTDGEKETLICLDVVLDMETVEYFKKNTLQRFICLERALDTTKKYNLKHYMGDKFIAF